LSRTSESLRHDCTARFRSRNLRYSLQARTELRRLDNRKLIPISDGIRCGEVNHGQGVGSELGLLFPFKLPHDDTKKQQQNAKNKIQVLKPTSSANHVYLNKKPNDKAKAKKQAAKTSQSMHAETENS